MPEFILVTGANATGKTTFIDSNLLVFKENNFEVIIPDRILNRPHSLDKDITIMDNVYNCINIGANFVFETPFQFDSLAKTIDLIYSKGYSMSLYQLFVNSLDESALRVADRYDKGGLFIGNETVKANFNANFKNVARFYYYFNTSYFIENSIPDKGKLLAAFKKMKLVYYCANSSSYLQYLFSYSASIDRMDESAMERIKANKDFASLDFNTERMMGFDR